MTNPFRPTDEELAEGLALGIDPNQPTAKFRLQLRVRKSNRDRLSDLAQTCSELDIVFDETASYHVMAKRLSNTLRERLEQLGISTGTTIWVDPTHAREGLNVLGGETWRITSIRCHQANSPLRIHLVDTENQVRGSLQASFVVQYWGQLVKFAPQ